MFNIRRYVFYLSVAVAVLGLIAVGQASAKVVGDTIVFGAAVSQTGKYSTTGKHTRKGYNLAIKRLNEMGGVKVGGKTYKLKILYYDDESTAARGAQLAERLIKQDGVKFMLGPYSSGLTKAIAPVTEKYRIPMVEGNGASRSLFNKGYRYIFAVLSTSDYYLREAINLAAEVAKKEGRSPKNVKVALAFENDPFSQDVRAGVLEDTKRWGMKVVVDDKLPPEINDMAATLTKVKALRPDVLVISGHSKGATLAIRQVSEKKVNVPMLAITHCEAARVIKQFGSRADYTLCAAQWAPPLTYEDKWFGSASDYAKTFKKEYGYVPPYQSAESTATVLVYIDALRRAGSFDTEKVRAAISKTNLKTFYGNIRFDKTGKNIAKPMVLRQIVNGKFKVVAPLKWATSKLIYPRPKWSKR